MWVHGMCTHELNWATDRAMRIASALGGAATQTGAVEETGGLTRILYQIRTQGGNFDATFVLWSPMTRSFKRTLDFDAPGNNRATSFPYQRASMNGSLKTELVNDCLSDAVVYSGQHGDVIRAAMKLAVCHELGGTPATGQPCDLTNAGPERPIVVITESLGSKVLFDAAKAVYHDVGPDPAARAAMNHRFASIQTIYLMANQIPLLDIASPMPPIVQPGRDGRHDAHGTNGNGAGACRGDGSADRGRVHRSQRPAELPAAAACGGSCERPAHQCASCRTQRPGCDLWSARTSRIADTHLNRTVMGLIAQGHKVGEPLPEAPVIASNQCF